MSNTMINSNEILLSRFVSSLSSTWNSNNDDETGSNNNMAAGSAAEDTINVHTISYPSFSMPDDNIDHHQQQQQQQQQQSSSSISSSSSSGREDVQSKISNLMSRKVIYEAGAESSEVHQEQQLQPGRMMLENISDSFNQLVDARIRAYAQILTNHVQVLRSSNSNNDNNHDNSNSNNNTNTNQNINNNERGALIAEYKLRTLLEFASTSNDDDDALFDSITTKFKVIYTSDDDDNDDDDSISTAKTTATATATATSTEKEEKLHDDGSSSENYNSKDKATTTTLPIEMTVEISSQRLLQQQEEYQEGLFEGKLIFKTTGKIHGAFLIGPSDDTTVTDYICLSQDGLEVYDSSCHEGHSVSATTTSTTNANENNKESFAGAAIAQHARLNEVFEKAQEHNHNHNIEIDINCEELLSQMIKEAGKVVTMIVELTNLAWTNDTKKQREIGNIIALNNMTQANVIADDDDDHHSSSSEIYIPPPPTAGSKRQRPRSDSLDDALMGPPRNVHIDVQHHHRRHFSELPYRSGGSSSSTLPLLPLVSEEESIVDSTTPPSSSFTSTTITTATTTFTNLDVVHRDTERKRKSRDFVSIDHSFEASTFSELDDCEHHEDHHDRYHEEHEEEDNKNNNNDADVDVEYYKIAAERACDIVDFVFAGEEIYKSIDVPTTATVAPSSSASSCSNKRPCVTK